MIKLFATDLDGTLLKDHRYIEKENQEAIQALYQNGTEIAFATGRSDRDIVCLFNQLDINGHRVSQNGAYIINKAEEIIFKRQFSKDLSQVVYQQLKKYPAYYFVTTKDDILFEQDIPILNDLQVLFNHRLIHTEQLEDKLKHQLDITKFMLLGEIEQLLVIQSELNARFKGKLESVLSAPKCMDIMPTGVNKQIGLDQLIQTMSIKPEEIAVIGDSQNDIEMLQMTPHNYVMSSADHDVKQAGKYIVNHVYEAIDHLKANGLL